MAAQASLITGQELAPAPVAEHAAWSTRGVKVLVAGVAALLAAVAVLWYSGKQTGDTATTLVWTGIIVLIIAALLLAGLTPVVPGQARVIQLFGKYRGTIRDPGLQWVNPFTRRIRVSTRIRNHETAQAKVNDADGNPIEIAAVVVWQVRDTAKAIYSVDEYTKFVAIQTETAVRHVASSYPYTSNRDAQLSLRDNAEEITQRLSAEIADRVAPAAWCSWPCGGWRRKTWSSWTRSARQRWCPTCWWSCAVSRPRSRSSTPAPSTSNPTHGKPVSERKSILLRLDPAVHDALARWANDELRSTNAQIEFLLRRALADAGRLPGRVGAMRRPGRPPRGGAPG